MKSKKKETRPLLQWAEKIGWKKRVKAVCKPCWEIKYCPYGPLVEDFPLKTEPDDKSCRIYGHDCPVFHVAEPLTETKELRNIRRAIPRVTQFKVIKRENQICGMCGKSVRDEDIEFDHIIPRSKGGSSEANNIRLLCKTCNRQKGKKFEDEYLVSSITEHVIEPIGIEIGYELVKLLKLSHEYYKMLGHYPDASDICKLCGRRKVRDEDETIDAILKNLNEFFGLEKPPTGIAKKAFQALKYRMGFTNREVHKIKDAAQKFKMKPDELLSLEISLINRLGWNVKLTENGKRKWLAL